MSVVESHKYGPVGWITFNRPNVLNAINEEDLASVDSTLRNHVADGSVRVIAITGTGRAFSAGADIEFLAGADEGGHRKIMEGAHAMMAAIEAAPKPIIAAVNGIAAGGGLEICLACDFVFADRGAQFGLTEIRYGFLPGGGGTQRLPRRVSWSDAMHLLCTGEMVSAQRAVELGIVFRLVENGEIPAAVKDFATQFENRSPEAVAAAKAMMRVAVSQPLDIGLESEIAANLRLLQSSTVSTAMAAFLSRRRQGKGEGGR